MVFEYELFQSDGGLCIFPVLQSGEDVICSKTIPGACPITIERLLKKDAQALDE
jgi:hypothetical protein